MAGSPAAPGLGVGAKGLETDRCGRGSGSHLRGGEPVGQQGSRRRSRGPAPPRAPSRVVQTERGATGPGFPASRIAGAGALRLRVSRGNLDPAAGGPGHREGIRRLIRPLPSGTDSEGLRLQPAEAGPAHRPAGRGSHQGVVGPALRGTEEKAIAEGRIILWTDESYSRQTSLETTFNEQLEHR